MKRNVLRGSLVFAGLCFVLSLLIFFHVKNNIRHDIFNDIENVKDKNIAIVLGAAIKDKRPGNYLQYRLDDAVELYKRGKVKKILVSGDNGRDAYDEISVMNNYLLKKGIPQNVIFGDYAGFDTYSTMERAVKVFDIKDAVIVSQGFHLPRAVYIAKQRGINATGYATRHSLGKRRYFVREYFATVKAFFDCLINRSPKYYGKKEDVNGESNIKIDQL